jgi:hypothetical protein
MQKEDGCHCDGCGQRLPAGAKLGHETVSLEEARKYKSDAPADENGMVTIDLCLACRIRRAEKRKGR